MMGITACKSPIGEGFPSVEDEEKRKYKWERCGIGKYVYQKDDAMRLEEKIRGYIHKSFPNAEIQYFT